MCKGWKRYWKRRKCLLFNFKIKIKNSNNSLTRQIKKKIFSSKLSFRKIWLSKNMRQRYNNSCKENSHRSLNYHLKDRLQRYQLQFICRMHKFKLITINLINPLKTKPSFKIKEIMGLKMSSLKQKRNYSMQGIRLNY